jgi:hypothetical protein
MTYVRGPALKGSGKLHPFDAKVLAALIAEHGYDGAASRLGVSPTLVDKLANDGAAPASSVNRMSVALINLKLKQYWEAAGLVPTQER